MSTIRWVYASGSQWVVFDTESQQHLEVLWSRESASWITSRSFGNQDVYVDTSEMLLMYGGYTYPIARTYY
ncbi:hypothetical protein EC973_001606 [Apophysomyces ossiformis]|uniref:Uncharacterized protein n=1 Tax=Apophysomyces ossiformis TaxID=679940 RepID=A0A8H7BU77_9FUNG|nr:hypothetical protein EC973_001606 [Apophysomyces ossiformis]